MNSDNKTKPLPFINPKFKKVPLNELIILTRSDKLANEELYKRLEKIIKVSSKCYGLKYPLLGESYFFEKTFYVIEFTKKIYNQSNGDFINLFRHTLKVVFNKYIKADLMKVSALYKQEKCVEIEENLVFYDSQIEKKYLINEILRYVFKNFGKTGYAIFSSYIKGSNVTEIAKVNKMTPYKIRLLLTEIQQKINVEFSNIEQKKYF